MSRVLADFQTLLLNSTQIRLKVNFVSTWVDKKSTSSRVSRLSSRLKVDFFPTRHKLLFFDFKSTLYKMLDSTPCPAEVYHKEPGLRRPLRLLQGGYGLSGLHPGEPALSAGMLFAPAASRAGGVLGTQPIGLWLSLLQPRAVSADLWPDRLLAPQLYIFVYFCSVLLIFV